MTSHGYSTKSGEGMAKAVARSLPISTKQSIEICNFIRNKNLDDARKILNRVIEKKTPVPFKRFTDGVGHKRGIASGRFPEKACKEFIKILDMVEANAQHKGLGSNLKIRTILAQRASTPWHFGRKRRRKMKRTHIEVVVEETKAGKKPADKKVKKEISKKKETQKKESKEEIKKEVQEKEEEIKDVKRKGIKEKKVGVKKEEIESKKIEKPEREYKK